MLALRRLSRLSPRLGPFNIPPPRLILFPQRGYASSLPLLKENGEAQGRLGSAMFLGSGPDDFYGPPSSTPHPPLDKIPTATTNSPSPTGLDVPGTLSRGRKLAIVFTCTKCDTRSAKRFTEKSYTHGVVLVRCPGCQSLHLIADNLGWFEDGGWNVEDLGEEVSVFYACFFFFREQ